MKKGILGIGTFAAFAASAALVAGSAFAGENASKTLETVEETAEMTAVDASSVVKSVMPSIVSVSTTQEVDLGSRYGFGFGGSALAQGAGSGIVADQTDDSIMIVTNKHVVSGADDVYVRFSTSDDEDEPVKAKVNGADGTLDLAILTVAKDDVPADVLDEVRVARFGSSEDLEVGDPALVIGNALGNGLTVTAGIVSALDRPVTASGRSIDEIQVDAAINLGCSGGALLNSKGEVVGITEAKAVVDYAESMGYAIPIDEAKPVMERLSRRKAAEEGAVPGRLGVSVVNVSKEASELYGLPEGAYVSDVQEDSAADKAGIKKGDVITGIDGEAVLGSESLVEIISYRIADERVEVTLMRTDGGDYEEKTVEATLDAVPEEERKVEDADGEKNEDEKNEDERNDDGKNEDERWEEDRRSDDERMNDDLNDLWNDLEENFPNEFGDGQSRPDAGGFGRF